MIHTIQSLSRPRQRLAADLLLLVPFSLSYLSSYFYSYFPPLPINNLSISILTSRHDHNHHHIQQPTASWSCSLNWTVFGPLNPRRHSLRTSNSITFNSPSPRYIARYMIFRPVQPHSQMGYRPLIALHSPDVEVNEI